MPLLSFSDLAFLWPFANEAKNTMIIYRQHEPPDPPDNENAMVALVGALGRITMDNSAPEVYAVSSRGQGAPSSTLLRGRHLIYVGGPARNQAAENFLVKCHELKLGTTVDFPGPDEARVLKVKGRKHQTHRAQCLDTSDAEVTVEYGLALLTLNPFDLESETDPPHKALFLAGLHGRGTLAVARAISRPDWSRDIVRQVVANFHLPLHCLGTVEVVIKTQPEVDTPRKRHRVADQTEPIVRVYIAVNGVQLYPRPKLKETKKFYVKWPFSVDNEIWARIPPSREQRPRRIEVSFVRAGTNEPYRTSDSGFTANWRGGPKPAEAFFKYFSARDVVVISPHSDDSVIGCGGLLYYLRNRDVWQGREERPDVHILVITASPRGVPRDEFQAYWRAIGVQRPPRPESPTYAQLCSQIRYNEALGEAFVLDTEPRWLDLRLDAPNTVDEVQEALRDIRKRARNRARGWTVLVPHSGDEHPTHRSVRELVLKVLRGASKEREEEGKNVDVWSYESPWGSLSRADINVILPLDKHAMAAKCQAIAMHLSQEVRTHYSEVARTQARLKAEVVPELVINFGGGRFEWDFVEVFQRAMWQISLYRDSHK